jgi:hypothetical protein
MRSLCQQRCKLWICPVVLNGETMYISFRLPKQWQLRQLELGRSMMVDISSTRTRKCAKASRNPTSTIACRLQEPTTTFIYCFVDAYVRLPFAYGWGMQRPTMAMSDSYVLLASSIVGRKCWPFSCLSVSDLRNWVCGHIKTETQSESSPPHL